DFHLEVQLLASQRMIEIHGYPGLIEGLHHTWQLSIGGIVEDHQQTFGKLHTLELTTRHNLHVLRVGLAEALLRLNPDRPPVTGLEAVERLLESRQQIAVADLEGGGLLIEGT